MATVGLSMLYTAVKNDDGTVLTDADTGVDTTGVYALDTNKKKLGLGTKTANITNLAGTPVKIAGNNEVVDVTNPPASPSVAIDSNLINPFVKEKLLGRQTNGFGGYVGQDKVVNAALIIESKLPVSLKSIYFCFGWGIFTEASHNVQTDTATAETRDDDNITFSAMGYSGFNGKPFAIFYEDDKKFDKKKMFDLVFPGQSFVTDSHDGTQDASLHGGQAITIHGSSDNTTGGASSSTSGNDAAAAGLGH